jgi:uncharacterized protein YqcC (DUF446 family)
MGIAVAPPVVAAPPVVCSPPEAATGDNPSQQPIFWIVGGSLAVVLFALLGMLTLILLTKNPHANELAKTKTVTGKQPDPIAQPITATPREPIVALSNQKNPANKNEPEWTKPPRPEITAAANQQTGNNPIAPLAAGKQPRETITSLAPAKNVGRLPVLDEVEFMFVKGKGKRFCIIADRSGSMRSALSMNASSLKKGGKLASASGYRRIDYLKDELLNTVKSLKPDSEFSIILFDNAIHPIPGGDWLSSKDLDKTASWISGIEAGGSTFPLPAFEKAFQLNPRPDVIFFMTDGAIPPNTAAEVARLNNKDPRVVIHSIQLGDDQQFVLDGMLLKQQLERMRNNLKKQQDLYKGKSIPPYMQKNFATQQSSIRQLEATVQKYQGNSQLNVLSQLEIIAQDSGGTYRKIEDGEK